MRMLLSKDQQQILMNDTEELVKSYIKNVKKKYVILSWLQKTVWMQYSSGPGLTIHLSSLFC